MCGVRGCKLKTVGATCSQILQHYAVEELMQGRKSLRLTTCRSMLQQILSVKERLAPKSQQVRVPAMIYFRELHGYIELHGSMEPMNKYQELSLFSKATQFYTPFVEYPHLPSNGLRLRHHFSNHHFSYMFTSHILASSWKSISALQCMPFPRR